MTDQEYYNNLKVPERCIDAVLDTDAYNEIDDQFAIAYMLRSNEKINVKAIYAAPFFNSNSTSPKDGMERSYNEIINLLTLDKRDDFVKNVYKGSETYLTDEKTPVISDAAEHLAKLAMNYSSESPLYVVAIGAITNVASAILINPKIVENIVIVWLGGHALEWGDTKEFNMCQDYAAARIVFGCGAPLVQLPCFGVVDKFYTSEPELRYWLGGKNPLCDYLIKHTADAAQTYAKGRVWTRVIWDVTAVAWLLNDNDRFMKGRLEYSPIPEDSGHYSRPRRHMINYIYDIHRDCLFEDLFKKLSK